MADTRVLSRKPTDLLKEDHRSVQKLFADYEKLGDKAVEKKLRTFARIREELTVHAQIEEELFYPALRESEDEEARDRVHEALEEHNLVKGMLEEISSLTPEDEAFDAKMKVLKENVEHHIEEEEKELFPKASRLPSELQNELAMELQLLKRSLSDDTTAL